MFGYVFPKMELLSFKNGRFRFIASFALAHSGLIALVVPTMTGAGATVAVLLALGGGNGYSFLGLFAATVLIVWYATTAAQISFATKVFSSTVETAGRKTIYLGALILLIAECLVALPLAFTYQTLFTPKIGWGVIDKNGSFVVQPQGENPSHHTDSSNYLSNKLGLDGDPQLYEYHDKSQFGVQSQATIEKNNLKLVPYSEGLALAQKSSGDGWGYVDSKGKFVIPGSFDEARSFKDGLAAVALFISDYDGKRCSLGSSGSHWWGYIDRSGKWVVKPRFARAESFREGLACVGVRIKGKDPNNNIRYGYIDKAGKFVIPPVFSYAHSFWNGKADVAFDSNDRTPSKSTPDMIPPPSIPDGPVRSANVQTMVDDWARKQITTWRTGDSNKLFSKADCDNWLEQRPNDAEVTAVRAIVYCGEYPVKVKEAEKDARRAISIDPECALAYGVLGHVLDIQQKYEAAVKEYSKAIELEPNFADWYAFRGLAYEGIEDYKKAVADYTKQLELEPDSEWGLGERAHAFLSMNNYQPAVTDISAALRDIEAVLKLNAHNTYALKQRADAYSKKGDYQKALADLEKAESLLDPHSYELVEILDMQARYYTEVGKQDKAKEARKKCTALTSEINSAAK